MNRTIVVNALFGSPPFPPAISAWSKSWKPPMNSSVATKKWAGRKNGNVMLLNAYQAPAPSMAAAS